MLKNPVKCGYCKLICEENRAHVHGCLRGYDEFYVDPETKVMWGVDEEYKTLKIDRENVPNNFQTSNKNDSGNKANKKIDASANAVQKKIDQEEQLILEVMNRPALWDITIPLNKRGKVLKNKLWIEVSEALKGCFTADGAQKRFKSLKDTYRKMIQHEKHPSGSARKTCVNRWPHYKTMEFLRAQINCRQTTGNSEEEPGKEGAQSNSEDSEGAEFESEQPVKRTAKRKRCSGAENESLTSSFDKIAAAISESSKEIILPPPPVQDEIDSCVNLIACRLRKVPEINQSAAVNDILIYSFQVQQTYQNE